MVVKDMTEVVNQTVLEDIKASKMSTVKKLAIQGWWSPLSSFSSACLAVVQSSLVPWTACHRQALRIPW